MLNQHDMRCSFNDTTFSHNVATEKITIERAKWTNMDI